jgi:hypothetical protein
MIYQLNFVMGGFGFSLIIANRFKSLINKLLMNLIQKHFGVSYSSVLSIQSNL